MFLAAAPSASAQRLPAGVSPIHYDITVAPDLAAATFAGEVTIRVRLDEPASSIVLNAAEIVFQDVRITAAGTTQTATVSLNAAQEQATFTTPLPLPGGEAEIAVKYQGILNDDLRGLYLTAGNNCGTAQTPCICAASPTDIELVRCVSLEDLVLDLCEQDSDCTGGKVCILDPVGQTTAICVAPCNLQGTSLHSWCCWCPLPVEWLRQRSHSSLRA
jgi:hypothetical protein